MIMKLMTPCIFHGISFTQLSMKHANMLLCGFIILTTEFIKLGNFPPSEAFMLSKYEGMV